MTASGGLRAALRVVVPILLVLAVLGFIAFRFLQPLPVAAMPVVRGKAISAVYATGTVEAEDRVQVKAKTSGSVAELVVNEGDVVKAGDLLARIDNPTVTFDLKRGQGDLEAASAQAGQNAPQIAALRSQAAAVAAEWQVAKQDLERAEQLAATGALAQAEVDRARARTAQLAATIAANEAQQRALRIDLSANAARQAAQVQSLTSRVTDTEVRSPLGGVVLAKSVEPGEVVSVNQTLFKVGDLTRLLLEVSVDEADVAKIQDGKGGAPASKVAVSLYAFPHEVFVGRVFDIYPDANRERKSFLTKVRLDAPPPGLRSGMSAEVNIIASEREGALLVPSEAEQGGAVWVVRDGRAHRQPVTVGVRDLLRVEVLDGVAEGESVIVTEMDKLTEGQRVNVTLRQPDKEAPMPDATQPVKSSI